MGSPEDRAKHRKRIQNRKKKDLLPKIRSPEAKSLEDAKFHQRIITDKRGVKHDLSKMSFRDLVEAMEDNDDKA